MNPKRISGFTLVEALTGIVVIAAISTASWFAVSTLFRGEQLTRNRTVAINLLQKSQEEIRNASLTFYDTLQNCQFPGPAFDANININCGLQALNTYFTGYTRSVSVTPHSGSTEIKKATITVNWTDQGQTLSLYSAVLLARPPDPLPGNIIGIVRSSGTGNPLINGVSIKVELVGGTVSRTTTSKNTLGAKNESFDFFDASTGAFVLPVGTWRLTATHPSYYAYTHSADITVTSNAETRVDFSMDPKPQNATVKVRLINGITGAPLNNFQYGTYYILDDYATTNTIVASAGSTTAGDHTITFNDSNPKSFTVNTYNAFKSGQAGKPTCLSYAYNYNGQSTAHLLDDNLTTTCSNPYNGSSTSDRITVNSGDNNVVVKIPIYNVPTATVRGKVTDQSGVPIVGATLYAKWPSSDLWIQNGAYQTATTNAQGEYSYRVPATQEMLPNNNSGALQVYAYKSMPINGCCDSIQYVDRYSTTVPVTNLFEGALITDVNLTINSGGRINCGNVQGNIKDGASGAGLNSASVSVQGVGNTTATGGDYIYQCPSTGYRLPAGLARFYASKSNYYSYDSNGNNWYSPAAGVNIQADTMVDYSAKLWPVGTGTVIVTVLDEGSDFPIANINLKLTNYNSGQISLTTDSSGIATFNNTLETWPPVGLPNDAYYSRTPRGHSLVATDPSGFYPSASLSIPTLEKDGTLNVTIKLAPAGGT
ncbi:MAG: carboxypeptidase regulatory-like domain-containing protein [Candidatus Omnitrophica bacterium]|nr:carboxypeptidase regulatory-like domain-containing protein [Candidatus Omnitrophota bacterium]